LFRTDQLLETAAYLGGQSQFTVAKSSGTSEATDQIAWGAQRTAPASVLNGTNTGINFSALVQKQDVEASVT
jgi:hypothetical protein